MPFDSVFIPVILLAAGIIYQIVKKKKDKSKPEKLKIEIPLKNRSLINSTLNKIKKHKAVDSDLTHRVNKIQWVSSLWSDEHKKESYAQWHPGIRTIKINQLVFDHARSSKHKVSHLAWILVWEVEHSVYYNDEKKIAGYRNLVFKELGMQRP